MKPLPITCLPPSELEKVLPRLFRGKRNQQLLTLACFTLASSFAALTLSAAEPQFGPPLTNTLSASIQSPEEPTPGVWLNDIGEGFSASAQSVSLEFGASRGVAAFGGKQRHDLALASISYGYMLAPVCGGNNWYRGNWELRGELFTGAQFLPDQNWVVGLTPHLRYNFATGTRWVPFADAGAGVTAVGMGAPDLSGTFEFNLQAAVGTHYFIRNNLALTAEARFLHMSCGGLNSPNLGLNTVAGFVGLELVLLIYLQMQNTMKLKYPIYLLMLTLLSGRLYAQATATNPPVEKLQPGADALFRCGARSD